jgi:flagellar protein FlaI
MKSKKGMNRKIQSTQKLIDISLYTGIATLTSITLKINSKRNQIENKSQKQKLLLKEEQEKHYNEIVKKLDFTEKKTITSPIRDYKIIDEKKGFGWKALGSRRIIYDNNIKEYLYEVNEPVLSKEEEEIKNKLIYLFRVRTDIDVFGKEKNEKIQQLSKALEQIIIDNHILVNEDSKNRIFYHILAEFAGYGKIDILMQDEDIEDISCDGEEIPIFIYHKTLESIKSNIIYKDAESLDSFVVKLSQMCGKQISVYEPIVDGKLADGSRLQTTLAKTITKYSTFTIRKFREDPLTPIDLIANNTLSLDMAAYFWIVIEKGSSILFCGGTATGKTTMLNALSLFLPSTFKIVSIEDTREINLPHENWIPGTTRAGFSTSDVNKTGKDIDMFDLIRVALRQRPKVIIVGEVRGKEAYTLFQAMTTGHLSYSTIHASDMHALIQRLESPPIELPRALLTSLDLIVFLNSVTVGSIPVRRVTNVTEVIKLDPETNRLVTMTPFHWVSEIDDRFENTGGSQILYKIKLQNGWNDETLDQELRNRKLVLEWMIRKKLRNYEDVGRIVAEYGKDPNAVLHKVKEEP